MKGHSTRVSSNRQLFDEIDIQGFDFSLVFKCSDVHNFEKLKKFSEKIFELSFYQEGKMEWLSNSFWK